MAPCGWDRKRKMARQELETGLCELGNRIWEAIESDDAIADMLFKLVDMKLALDNVTLDDSVSRSRYGKVQVILTDVEDDATNLVRPKKFSQRRNETSQRMGEAGFIHSCDGLGYRPGVGA